MRAILFTGLVMWVSSAWSGDLGTQPPQQKLLLAGPVVSSPPNTETPQPGSWAFTMCGQLINNDGSPGVYVNLENRRWSPSERFVLWVQTTIPARMLILQEFPGTSNASIQISPDPRYQATYAPIQPGSAQRFPIALQLDPTHQAECITIRMETIQTPDPTNPLAAASANSGGATQLIVPAGNRLGDTIINIWNSATASSVTKKMQANQPFQRGQLAPSHPPIKNQPAQITESSMIDDVAAVIIGAGQMGAAHITLRKH